MGRKQIDPRQQFSKKLARWTAVFWFLYMTWLSIIMVIQPSATTTVVYMAVISSVVMLVNVWAYTRNSVYEKALLAAVEIDRNKSGRGDILTGESDEPENG